MHRWRRSKALFASALKHISHTFPGFIRRIYIYIYTENTVGGIYSSGSSVWHLQQWWAKSSTSSGAILAIVSHSPTQRERERNKTKIKKQSFIFSNKT